MGIALSAVHGFFAPLQGLMAWLVAAPGPSRPAAAPVFVAPHAAPARAASRFEAAPPAALSARRSKETEQ